MFAHQTSRPTQAAAICFEKGNPINTTEQSNSFDATANEPSRREMHFCCLCWDNELNASATGPQQTNILGLHNSRRTSQQKLIATPKVIVPVSSFSSEGVDSRLFDSQVQVLRSMIQHFIAYYKKLECSKNYNLSTNEFEIIFHTTRVKTLDDKKWNSNTNHKIAVTQGQTKRPMWDARRCTEIMFAECSSPQNYHPQSKTAIQNVLTSQPGCQLCSTAKQDKICKP